MPWAFSENTGKVIAGQMNQREMDIVYPSARQLIPRLDKAVENGLIQAQFTLHVRSSRNYYMKASHKAELEMIGILDLHFRFWHRTAFGGSPSSGLALEMRQKSGSHDVGTSSSIKLGKPRSQQGIHVVVEPPVAQTLIQRRVRLGKLYTGSLLLQIPLECRHCANAIDDVFRGALLAHLPCMTEVEKVSTLLALHQRTHLGPQHLTDIVRPHQSSGHFAVIVQ